MTVEFECTQTEMDRHLTPIILRAINLQTHFTFSAGRRRGKTSLLSKLTSEHPQSMYSDALQLKSVDQEENTNLCNTIQANGITVLFF